MFSNEVTQRFWAKVEIGNPDACWVWTGNKDKGGYGCFKMDGKQYIASRVSYMLAHGPIPAGMLVCHKCDNPSCVNPDHLFIGTYTDNLHDMINKGRGNWRKGPRSDFDERGEKNPRAKLTWEKVREIRKSYGSDGVTHKSLAEKYGVSKRAILFILQNITWVE